MHYRPSGLCIPHGMANTGVDTWNGVWSLTGPAIAEVTSIGTAATSRNAAGNLRIAVVCIDIRAFKRFSLPHVAERPGEGHTGADEELG